MPCETLTFLSQEKQAPMTSRHSSLCQSPIVQQQSLLTALGFLLAVLCLHISFLLFYSESPFPMEPQMCELPPAVHCDNFRMLHQVRLTESSVAHSLFLFTAQKVDLLLSQTIPCSNSYLAR